MPVKPPKDKLIRIPLGVFLLFMAFNSIGGGIYGMGGARDISAEWLQGSPFQSYFLPSLFLFLVIGGSCLYSGIIILTKKSFSRKAAFFSGALLILWIIIQALIIGYVSWMQPAVVASGIVIVFLAGLLPAKSGNGMAVR